MKRENNMTLFEEIERIFSQSMNETVSAIIGDVNDSLAAVLLSIENRSRHFEESTIKELSLFKDKLENSQDSKNIKHKKKKENSIISYLDGFENYNQEEQFDGNYENYNQEDQFEGNYDYDMTYESITIPEEKPVERKKSSRYESSQAQQNNAKKTSRQESSQAKENDKKQKELEEEQKEREKEKKQIELEKEQKEQEKVKTPVKQSILPPSYASYNARMRASPTISTSLSCPKCGKMYASKQNLDRHVRDLHDNNQIFSCTDCPFTTKQKLGMTFHMSTFHSPTYIKPDRTKPSLRWMRDLHGDDVKM